MLTDDQERSLYESMQAIGLAPKDRQKLFSSLRDGKITRYQVEDDKSGSLNGACVVYQNSDKPAGWFWTYKNEEKQIWTSFAADTLSDAEKQAWKAKQREIDQARQLEQQKVWAENKQKVVYLLKKSGVASNKHPYLQKKQVRSYGLRQLKESLVVPVRNGAGDVISAQFITAAGDKRFKTGAQVKGGYFAIGQPVSVLLICEGYATGASLHEATGYAVAIAFDAGNLLPVAKVLREKLGDVITIIVCADNDVAKERNTGLINAQVCAEQVGGLLVYPEFQDQKIEGKIPTDFNDLHCLFGLDAVKTVVNAVLQPAAPVSHAPQAEQRPAGVVKNKQYFLELIENSDDFDYLTETLLKEISLTCELKAPLVEFLISQIAKKCETTKAALMDEVKSMRAESGANALYASDDSVIAELNREHAVLPIGGKTVIMNREWDPVLQKKFFTFSGRTDFELKYLNRRLLYQGDELSHAEYWLKHPDRAQYRGVVFSPEEELPGYLNYWQGWGIEASDMTFQEATHACFAYLDFVVDVICSNDQVLFDYLMNWCAHLVQYPANLPETALVFRGREGIGKNSFVDPLEQIVGREHSLMLTQMSQITGRFSGHLSNALLVFCNESVWGGDKSAQGVLKSMITDKIQPVEYKGKDLTQVKSFKRCIFATNETWAVPRGPDDRRYVIVDVSDKRKGDTAFFRDLKNAMANGGSAALFRYLQLRNIEGWHPRQIPEHILIKGWEMKVLSSNSVARWWLDILQHGYVYEDKDTYSDESRFVWPDKCQIKVIEHSYLKHCDNYKVNHPEHISIIGKALHDWGLTTCRPANKTGPRPLFYKFPELDKARELFSQRWGIPESYWGVHEDGNAFA